MENTGKKVQMRFVFVFALVTFSAIHVIGLDNGLAKTPPMGWNSWNIFAGNIDETKIKQIADVMVSSGMRDAGYVYLNLDDNWMAASRDGSGNLRCDPTRFPGGMKALGDYIHSKGLKFGIYGDRGTMTCMNVSQSGSYGNEQRDANTFASWGVDYLKYDNCNAVGNMQTDYTNMKNALASCGRPIVFSICAWQFQSWMPATGNLWRVSEDIIDTWDNGTSWGKGIIECIDANRDLASYAKPGAWNDPDMLEIGKTGCSTEEYRTQMSMWSIMASPLIAGNDIRSMSQTTKDILLNAEVIAVDQDAAGIQGTRISASNGLEVWCKPLGSANGTIKAVALLNRNSSASNITVTFSNIGLSGAVTVRDLWAKADRGSYSNSYTMSVPAHGTGMLKISSGSEPTAVPTAIPTTGPTPGPTGVVNGSISIACGSSADVGAFQPDQYFSGGSTFNNTNTVDVSQITGNPPPASLFNNERYGAMSYTIPGFTSGSRYAVTLYFAETYLTSFGSRLFNVSVNGAAALADFDIYASAGGQNKAIARSFATMADSSGQIAIQFTAVTENPKINGIRIDPDSDGGNLGDANGNGTTDIVDALLIAQYYVGLNPQGFIAANADVNCSGGIDIVDALLVAQFYVGLISSFPC